jgi:hypothetical protein
MPAFGVEHGSGADSDTWKLVLFLRHLPSATVDELKRMESLNPKTEEERQEEEQEQEFLRGESLQNQGNESHHN